MYYCRDRPNQSQNARDSTNNNPSDLPLTQSSPALRALVVRRMVIYDCLNRVNLDRRSRRSGLWWRISDHCWARHLTVSIADGYDDRSLDGAAEFAEGCALREGPEC